MDGESAKLGVWTSSPLTLEILLKVEEDVRDLVKRNFQVFTVEIPLNVAKQMHFVRWVLGEYYPDPVRLVSIGTRVDIDTKQLTTDGVSAELCCGTHVRETGDIQLIRIISLKSTGSGVKLITYTAGASAIAAEKLAADIGADVKIVCGQVLAGETQSDVLSTFRDKVTDAFIPLDDRNELLKLITETQNRSTAKGHSSHAHKSEHS